MSLLYWNAERLVDMTRSVYKGLSTTYCSLTRCLLYITFTHISLYCKPSFTCPLAEMAKHRSCPAERHESEFGFLHAYMIDVVDVVIGELHCLAIRPHRKTDMSLFHSADEDPDRRPDLSAWHEDGGILVKRIRI